ncbi:hypothetical protein BV921_14935 [Pectobacterium odoriferum]|nr:hypothetical protein BV925_20940 [Pectobacterium odoriferum]POE08530.1 hypothetical protein BV921_14935 [Pectobacterium odoriferum]
MRDCCYDRHRSVRFVICFDLAIDQIAQLGLSSLQVIYHLVKLFRATFPFSFKFIYCSSN